MVRIIQTTNGGFTISKIKQIQGRIFGKLLVENGINQFNGAQGRILFVLWNNDNIPISELSEKTGLAKTTMTSMLDRLESSKYVKREYNPADRRKVNIQLTETAIKMKKQYEKVSTHMNEIFYKNFSDKEIIIFEQYLTQILNNLTNKEKEK